MNILSIGNSFSQDAHKWLHKLAVANGLEVDTVNLYIGGCSLEQHWQNAVQNAAEYDLEINGGSAVGKTSITQALAMDTFDAVTLQQASHVSGMFESYTPYITELAELIREKQPSARLWFHQTWTYEKSTPHASFSNYYHQIFANYNFDQEEMFRRIERCSERAAKLIGADLIRVGTVIQKLRRSVPAFDYEAGGLSLSRDGYHLSWDYGRYAAAATWLYTLTDALPKAEPFEDFDTALLKNIIKAVAAV